MPLYRLNKFAFAPAFSYLIIKYHHMKKECYLLEKCGFFNKYNCSGEIDCQEYIEKYCRGEMMIHCKRLQYRNRIGVAPSDDMMPSGAMMR